MVWEEGAHAGRTECVARDVESKCQQSLQAAEEARVRMVDEKSGVIKICALLEYACRSVVAAELCFECCHFSNGVLAVARHLTVRPQSLTEATLQK